MKDYYDDYKDWAATNQGLDPLTQRVKEREGELYRAGVEYAVEQTGGFTMVATFYTSDEAITCTFESDRWYVYAQPKENWTEGEYDEESETTDLSSIHHTPDTTFRTSIIPIREYGYSTQQKAINAVKRKINKKRCS